MKKLNVSKYYSYKLAQILLKGHIFLGHFSLVIIQSVGQLTSVDWCDW